MKVNELLCPLTNAWNLEKIRAIMPHYEEHILRLITSSAPSQDCLAWLFDKSGQYSVRSDYNVGLLDRQLHLPATPIFNWMKNVWNVHTAPILGMLQLVSAAWGFGSRAPTLPPAFP